MKHVVNIVGALLGLVFLNAASMMLFGIGIGPAPEPPEPGSAAEHFGAAFGPTGWLKFVKVFELAGAVLVAIPRTRCIGLLLLGPIIVNIVAFHFFVSGKGLSDPIVVAVTAAAVFLLLAEHKAFAHLVTRPLPGSGAR